MECNPEWQVAFEDFKEILVSTSALALPGITKPFQFARGVLAQILGPWKRSMAYLSKRPDPVANFAKDEGRTALVPIPHGYHNNIRKQTN